MKRVLIIGLLMGAGALAMAQSGEVSATPHARHGLAAPSPMVETPTVSVDFKGGTLAEYVTAIRAAQPSANLAYTPEAGGMSVPAIMLKDAELFEAIRILRGLVSEGAVSLEIDEIHNAYAIATRSNASSETLVLSVQQLLNEGMKAEDILSAFDAAVQSTGGSMKIKFHRETSLIFATGTPAELQMIAGVSGSLRNSAISGSTSIWSRYDALESRVAALEARKQPE